MCTAFVCQYTCVGMFVFECAYNEVHLAAELSSGAPGVSVAHCTPPHPFLLATALLSCDTPAHLNGPPYFLSATSIILCGLTNPGRGSRCFISKETNFSG
ncbi:hypothetical protein XENOCAPTIV_030269 [Xenoophorus captivus]|uniref:Secreted protein n=2 Tax=Goodeidae TaxID=28758 RepID=A0ABV0SDD0_9TELE